MKKPFIGLLCLMLSLGFVGCGKKAAPRPIEKNQQNGQSSLELSQSPVRVG